VPAFLKIRDIYDLEKSMKSVGQLYPILLDSTGKHVIDGSHRLQIDPNWKQVRLDHIENKRDILIARIIANICRREIPSNEKCNAFNELAETLIKQYNVPVKYITKTISKITGISYRTISRYLSIKFKDQSAHMRAIIGGDRKIAAKLAAIDLNDVNGILDYKQNIRKIIFFTSKEKGNLVSVVKSVIKSMEKTDYHSHSSDFYSYCLEGKGKCQIGGKIFPIKPGTLFYCGKYLPYQVMNTGNIDLERLSFFSPPIKLENLISEDKASKSPEDLLITKDGPILICKPKR